MANIGKVFLIGAGPGHPGLISLRGIECLKQAEVVLYDGLVNPLLLRHTQASCERTCRTDGPDGRVLQQEEINQRLVRAAHEGKTVARLKGGDPFIFGRGSEEAAFLRAHGVDFEIVPGITAATAAGEFAGLSLTHRDHASMVTFITGHETPDKEGSNLDYALIAKLPGTLVFYMGLHRLPDISAALLRHGKSASTPTAVISKASTPFQRCVTAGLNRIADEVSKADLHAPSLIIVGECVRQRDQLRWFEDQPLFGQRIGITRAEHQTNDQINQAYALGADPVLLPSITITPRHQSADTERTFNRLHEFDWLVFTSVNGIDCFFDLLLQSGRDIRSINQARIAVIGASSAQRLANFHLSADIVPHQFRAEALASALSPRVKGQRVLWVRANRGRDVLRTEMNSAGADFEELVVYDNSDIETWSASQIDSLTSLDWIALSSPSIARNVARLIPESIQDRLNREIKLVSISPVTTKAARDSGLTIDAEATTFTWDGIFQAIIDHST